MTPEQEIDPTRRFVPALQPWLLAAGFFLIYVFTLNHWVSFGSLGLVAKASGWTWQPDVYQPLNWLLTRAFHLLPVKLIPLAFNLFAAMCAALSLGLLARSVALLPHDRTEEQRARERGAFALLSIPLSWLPPILAALVCGLQLAFWENATAASGEMLDLLLFAYVIHCLLEFRIDDRESRLFRAAVVYGVAMANNWAMIGFAPAFLIALLWIKGFSFFNGRFVLRLSLCLLAGLSFYLLLPLVQSHSDVAPVPFWEALKANLFGQKTALFFLPFSKDRLLHGLTGDQPFWVLTLPSLLPVLIMGIRWPSYFGDPSKLGVALTTLIFHIFHAFLLVFCIWVALDTKFSPRAVLPGLPLLTFGFLGALSVGYYSGYFLLVFRSRPPIGVRPRPTPLLLRLVHTAVCTAVCLLVVLVPALLVYRNLPPIRLTNGSALKRFVAAQAEALPAKNTVVLSDDSTLLLLAQAFAAQNGSSQRRMFVDTAFLLAPDYHRFLKKQHHQRWPIEPPKGHTKPVEQVALVDLLLKLAKANDVFYLHPSYGYYFEFFYPEPHGLAYRLVHYPTNSFFTPLPSQPLIDENENFWTRAEGEDLKPLLAGASPPPLPSDASLVTSGFQSLIARLHLARVQSDDATLLASRYSRALDFWGVKLQKAGQLTLAAARFSQALKLNPDNRPALANKECNAGLQAGRKLEVQDPKAIEDRFGKYRTWEPLMTENGPFDDPTFCYEEGRIMVLNGNLRQGTELLARAAELAPDDLNTRLYLGQAYNVVQMPAQALDVVRRVHSNTNLAALSSEDKRKLLVVEASAHLALGNPQAADSAVKAVLQESPNNADLLIAASQVYMTSHYYSNALATLDQLLRLAPTNTSALVNKGYAYLQLGAFNEAVPPLTKALSLETNASELHNSALLNRAIAYLSTLQLEPAQQDYETLQRAFPTAFQLYYGLAEIAYRKKDTNAAIRNCQLYLTNAPAGTAEAKFVAGRLKDLKAGSP